MPSGGKREGAGRKPSGRTYVHLWVTERAKAQAAALKAEGYDVSLGVETMLEQACRDFGIEI